MFGHQLLQQLVYFTQVYLSLDDRGLQRRPCRRCCCCIDGQCVISVAVNDNDNEREFIQRAVINKSRTR